VAAKSSGTTVAAYAYDALGRRITETYSGSSTTNNLYYSAQWQVIEERQNGTGTSNVSYQYVWGAGYIDELVLRDSYSGGSRTLRLYVQQDANFNVTAVISTAGAVQERYLYDPYGSVTITDASYNPRSGNTSNYAWIYLHQGGRLDGVTGWYVFRFRDYIPSEGRWAERDPLGYTGDGGNLYHYLDGSPLGSTDAIGLMKALSEAPCGIAYDQELGQGDLVIVTGDSPANLKDLEGTSRRQGFTLMPGAATSLDDLIAKLKSSSNHGQKKYRRIVIVGHAGGMEDGPSLSLDKEKVRLTSSDFGTQDPKDRTKIVPSPLSKAITEALEEDGVLVIAACGYYHWTNEYDVLEDIGKLLADPAGDKFKKANPQRLKDQTPEYRDNWKDRARDIARATGRRVAVALRDVVVNPKLGFPFIPSQIVRSKPLMVEVSPDGEIQGLE
jgi:RHS repeat-associated protein